jgi:uncharacterized membrane protein
MRNNDFSLYHAKQCMMIWLLGLAGGAIAAPLCAVCIGFIILPVLILAILVLLIMGIIAASSGEAKPLPLIGAWGEEWFKGITKA